MTLEFLTGSSSKAAATEKPSLASMAMVLVLSQSHTTAHHNGDGDGDSNGHVDMVAAERQITEEEMAALNWK